MQHLDHADTTTPATCPSHRTRAGEPVWCQACHDRLPALLWRLLDHYTALGGARGLTLRSTGRTGTRVDPPSPNPWHDAADEIDDVLSDWAGAWLTHRGHHIRRERSTHWAVRVLTNPRIGDVWTWPDSAGLAGAVRLLLAGAQGLLGGSVTDEPIHTDLRAPCPDCGLCRLTQEDGIGWITCRYPGCDLTMTEAEYAGWSTWLLASAGRGSVAA